MEIEYLWTIMKVSKYVEKPWFSNVSLLQSQCLEHIYRLEGNKRFDDYLYMRMVAEIIIGENVGVDKTYIMDTTHMLFECDSVNKHNEPVGDTKILLKISNVIFAWKFVEPHIGTNVSLIGFGLPFILRIHSIVGKDGLFEHAGTFRTTMASGSITVVYANPSEIYNRLNSLITWLLTKWEDLIIHNDNIEERIINAIRIVTLFFSEFLFIHPFTNGNGRIARILVSYIMRHVCIVPLSLYLNKINEHDIYIKILFDAQQRRSYEGLFAYFMRCFHRCVTDFVYLNA